MNFNFLGGEYAPTLLDVRPAAEPGIIPTNAVAIDLVRLFALDSPSVGRRRLVCHWHRADGRLSSIWEPDIVPIPQR
jgi:hypothetical protein